MANILIGTATTNASGVAQFTNLAPGNYMYRQTGAKTGYTTDTTEYTFTVSSATPVTASREISPTETGTLIAKKHVTGDENQLVAGATFTLKDANGVVMQTTQAASTTGYTTFANMMSITGTPQDYRIVEHTAPPNFAPNTTEYTNAVTVGADATRPVPNDPSFLGEFDATLTDTNYDEYGLQGAQYTLYWQDNN